MLEFDPTPESEEIEKVEKMPVKKEKKKKEKKVKIETERVGGPIPKDLAEWAKNVAFWVPGKSLSGLIEEGLRGLYEKYGQQKPREGELKRGRRPKIEEPENVESGTA